MDVNCRSVSGCTVWTQLRQHLTVKESMKVYLAWSMTIADLFLAIFKPLSSLAIWIFGFFAASLSCLKSDPARFYRLSHAGNHCTSSIWPGVQSMDGSFVHFRFCEELAQLCVTFLPLAKLIESLISISTIICKYQNRLAQKHLAEIFVDSINPHS